MRASSGSSRFVDLRIEGRSAEESKSGRIGGGLGSLAVVVGGVLPVGYLSLPGKDKGKISGIRYPCGSEYLRPIVRYAEAVGPSRVELLYAKTFSTCYRPHPGVRIWCPDLLTSYVFPFPRWFASLRRPLRTVSASLRTISSKASYSISICARPSSLPIFGASGRPSGCF